MSEISERIDKLLESGVDDPNDILGGLADKSEQMTPQEFHEYLYSSAPYFKQMLGASLDDLPEVKALLLTEPQWGVKPESYAKLFGKQNMTEEEFLRNVDKIPVDEMQYIAETKGLDFKEMLEDIRQRQTAQLRKDIAEGYGEGFGGKIANKITNLVAPKSMQAVYEGRDPTTGEKLGDITTNISYAVPWGKAVNNPLTKAILGNVTAPVIAEGVDVAVGDEDKTALERLANIGTGAAINFTTPRIMSGIIGKVPGGQAIAQKMEQKTAKELANETQRAMKKQASVTKSALLKAGKGKVGDMTAAEYQAVKGVAPQKLLSNKNGIKVSTGAKEVITSSKTQDKMLEIASQPGKTFNTKLNHTDKETQTWFNKKPKKLRNQIISQTQEQYGKAFNGASDLWGMGSSYGTNKFGDWFFEGDLSKMRGVGPMLVKAGVVESEAERKRREKLEEIERNKQKAIENFRTRGLLMEGK